MIVMSVFKAWGLRDHEHPVQTFSHFSPDSLNLLRILWTEDVGILTVCTISLWIIFSVSLSKRTKLSVMCVWETKGLYAHELHKITQCSLHITVRRCLLTHCYLLSWDNDWRSWTTFIRNIENFPTYWAKTMHVFIFHHSSAHLYLWATLPPWGALFIPNPVTDLLPITPTCSTTRSSISSFLVKT